MLQQTIPARAERYCFEVFLNPSLPNLFVEAETKFGRKVLVTIPATLHIRNILFAGRQLCNYFRVSTQATISRKPTPLQALNFSTLFSRAHSIHLPDVGNFPKATCINDEV